MSEKNVTKGPDDNSIPPVAQRFLRYVAIDTQSKEGAESYPSTEKQKDLSRLLVRELNELGLKDAAMDEWGYVTATLPGNTNKKDVPVIGLIAHVDTSPEVSGQDVKPNIHYKYSGGPIEFTGDKNVSLDPESAPHLKECVGHDIITSDGTTLLGADDKAGIAEIMTAIEWFIRNPQVLRVPIRVAFTCDEEIGRGTEHFDPGKFGATYAYTVDGETAGEIEDETFCADSAKVAFTGCNVHPGYGKDKLVNSMKAAGRFLGMLPHQRSPEATGGRQGYLHPISVQGDVESTTIKLIVRDFEEKGLESLEEELQSLVSEAAALVKGVSHDVEINHQYRNMKKHLDEDPRVVDFAIEAVKRTGFTPTRAAIRGGTDGARLTYMGLLTPNIFTGGHNFHARDEWISIQHMELAVKTLVELVKLWEERA